MPEGHPAALLLRFSGLIWARELGVEYSRHLLIDHLEMLRPWLR